MARLLPGNSAGCPGCTRTIARLIRDERTLDERRRHLRNELEDWLRRARGAGIRYDEMATEVVAALGGSGTATEHERVAHNLRQRASKAARRVSAADKSAIAGSRRDRHHGRKEKKPMNPNDRMPLHRRVEVVEEWFDGSAPPCTPPPFEDAELPHVDDGQLGGFEPHDHEEH